MVFDYTSSWVRRQAPIVYAGQMVWCSRFSRQPVALEHSGVMTGGEELGARLPGEAPKSAESDKAIAHRVRIGCVGFRVFGEEVAAATELSTPPLRATTTVRLSAIMQTQESGSFQEFLWAGGDVLVAGLRSPHAEFVVVEHASVDGVTGRV